ncbi:N-6 DNA methylase [Methylobacterium sp. B1]|uniref:N-6 DNA methylase n=1 Tax=Methylobacterium sp. B1 TaxID=91459 RepID=UPI0005BCBB3B|nr:N-6 DNA methylase [Methylobacterium sp. B1]
MSAWKDTFGGLAAQLRPLGRVESGRRVLALLALGLLACRIEEGADWRTLRNKAANAGDDGTFYHALVALARCVEERVPTLEGVFTASLIGDVAHAGAALPQLVLMAARMVELRAAEDVPEAEFFDAAVAEFGQGGGPAGEPGISRPLAELMVDLLQPRPASSVLDPRCGVATTLLEVSRREPSCRVRGFDLNPLVTALAMLRMHFLGADAEISVADALNQPIGPETKRRFDHAVCAPPLSVKVPRQERMHLAGRYNLVKAVVNSEAALLLECAEALRPGGRAAVLMPIAFLFRSSDAEIRCRLLQQRQVEGVVTLPTGVVPSTELAFAIVVLRAAGGRTGQVRLVNGEGLDIRTHRGAERLTAEHIDWLSTTYRDGGADSPVAISVRSSALLERDGNLRPQVWLLAPDSSAGDLRVTYQAALAAEREAAAIAERIDGLPIVSELDRRFLRD